MNIVEVYKTTDAKLFEDRTEALDHQIHLDRRKALAKWLELHISYVMNHCDIIDAMLEDSATLSKILE